jgi:UDP-galactopyranose mutase
MNEQKFEYDYLIAGAGLYGAVFAYVLNQRGKRCLVIDKRKHIGGNIYCEKIEGINVHKYGPHIFHTDSKKIWDFVNSFVEFNRFTYSPIACYKGNFYNLPFNMNTFYQLWKTDKPHQAKKIIDEQVQMYGTKNPENLEEQALSLIGYDLYQRLVKGYTEKQWGMDAKDVPAFIIKRIPLRFTFDNNYYDDPYQGIPIGGYNVLIEKLLIGIEVRLGINILHNKEYFEGLADKIIYTGSIDEFFNYSQGKLNYRSLTFENEVLDMENFQGNAAINYTEREIPYTRIVEHKHFEFGKQKQTVITREYPADFTGSNEPFYPINDEKNQKIFGLYKILAGTQDKYLFGGRLGDYKYYDMDDIIMAGLKLADTLSKN